MTGPARGGGGGRRAAARRRRPFKPGAGSAGGGSTRGHYLGRPPPCSPGIKLVLRPANYAVSSEKWVSFFASGAFAAGSGEKMFLGGTTRHEHGWRVVVVGDHEDEDDDEEDGGG